MIQKTKKSAAVRSLMIASLCAVLFSFSGKPGGDSFEVYLDDQLVFRQHVFNEEGVKTVSVSEQAPEAMLEVRYSHCGKVGTARNLMIKDNEGKLLKEWHFPDDGKASAMGCRTKELIALQKTNRNARLNLFYSSHELANSRMLAKIVIANETKASLR